MMSALRATIRNVCKWTQLVVAGGENLLQRCCLVMILIDFIW